LSGYLLDTDWIIDMLNGRTEARRVIDSLNDEVAMSIVSCAELFEGTATLSRGDIRRDELERFVESATVIGLDTDIARTFGSLRARLRTAGQLIGDMDLLIAATAVRWDMTLITRDRHFERIGELKRLPPT
jgi:predicted nucleic acid-binding protein